MASVFCDSEGIVFINYMPKGQTITGPYYADLIPTVRDAIKEKRRGKLASGVLFLDDNVSAHTDRKLLKLIHTGFDILDHPQCSPDLMILIYSQNWWSIGGIKFDGDDPVRNAVYVFFKRQENDFLRKE